MTTVQYDTAIGEHVEPGAKHACAPWIGDFGEGVGGRVIQPHRGCSRVLPIPHNDFAILQHGGVDGDQRPLFNA
jgi:hypothetical protein